MVDITSSIQWISSAISSYVNTLNSVLVLKISTFEVPIFYFLSTLIIVGMVVAVFWKGSKS